MAKYKVLIIDNEEANRTAVGEYLAHFGYEIFHAGSAREGLEMIKKTSPSLVLMDIDLKDADGFQVLERIKNSEKFANTPVVILSELTQTNLKVKGLEMGADDYITRPFDKAELLARLRVALRRSGQYKPTVAGTLAGNLSDVGLVELLQTIEMGGKTAVVKLKNVGGLMVMEKGRLIFAQQRHYTGSDALHRILLLESGEFSVKFNQIPAGYKEHAQEPVRILETIMNSLAHIDEMKSMVEENGLCMESEVVVTHEIKELKGGDSLRENTTVRLIDLIATLEGDLKDDIADTLMTMYKEKRLVVMNKQ